MFRKNPDEMRMEPTPERVYAVCRMIRHNPMSKEELKFAFSLGKNKDKVSSEITHSVNVAEEELGIIRNKDGVLELNVPSEVLDSPESFRRYVSKKVFSDQESTFYLFSKWMLAQNERIYTFPTWETMAITARNELPALTKMKENAALGWRFWAAFLGLGYLNRTNILPNMTIRVQDVLATEFLNKFKFNELVLATDFVPWLNSKLPETQFEHEFCLGVSSALRTLNALGLIRLENWPDAIRYNLYPVKNEPVIQFSHITVFEEVCK